MKRLVGFLLLVMATACGPGQAINPNVLVIGIQSAPNSLDPRVGLDDASQKIHALIFDNLMELDDHMRVVPKLAERLDQPTPTTYIVRLKHGVRFQDGHELTSATSCTRTAACSIPTSCRRKRAATAS